jgi:hypothetical protein
MTDHKKKHDAEQDQDKQQHYDPANHEGDLLDYDPEKAQELIDVDEAAEAANQVSSPNPDDPQHPDHGVPPGQENVSQGFTTGRGMQGGSANRRKRSEYRKVHAIDRHEKRPASNVGSRASLCSSGALSGARLVWFQLGGRCQIFRRLIRFR